MQIITKMQTQITFTIKQGDQEVGDTITVSDPQLLNTPEFIYTELMIKLEAMIKQVRNNSVK